MKWINNNTTLCLEFADMVQVMMLEKGVSEQKADKGLREAKAQGTKGYAFTSDPDDGRKVLFEFKQMDRKYKRMVERWLQKLNNCQHQSHENCTCGDPYRHMQNEPIRRMATIDDKAMQYYLRYEKPDGGKLPAEKCKQLALACGLFNNILAALADKRTIIKQQLGFKEITAFHASILEYCTQLKENGRLHKQFATSYVRYLKNLDEYKAQGYAFFIHGQIGNGNNLKIADGLAKHTLKTLLAHPLQYDDVMVCTLYNQWAEANGYESIKPGIVTIRRKEWEPEILASREGKNAFNEKFVRQVKKVKPSAPLYLVECDDYYLNYYFSGENGQYERYVSYIVADSFNGLILGKSYLPVKAPVMDMVYMAWIDAMYYIKNLVNDGNWYLPFEIKADGWQQSTLHPYFNSIATMIPAGHANKHRGYIEQLFGSPHIKRCEKLAAHKHLNYNGNNVTAKRIGVNLDVLKTNEKFRPVVGAAADEQVELFFTMARQLPAVTKANLNAPSKEQQWLAAFNELTEKDKRVISDEQFLLTFGFTHKPQGRKHTITNRGVEFVLNGQKYSYDLPNYIDMLDLIGEEITVHYDPYDMSRILVNNSADIRFVAQAAAMSAAAIKDATPATREVLQEVLADKKQAWKRSLPDATIDSKLELLTQYMPKEKAALHQKRSLETIEVSEEVEDDYSAFSVSKMRLNR
jgi:hypothetical protein